MLSMPLEDKEQPNPGTEIRGPGALQKSLQGFSEVLSVLITGKEWMIVLARAKPEAISNRPRSRLLRRSAPRNDMIGPLLCGPEL